MTLNEFRLVGDFLHAFAILFLIVYLIKTRSCYSISGMSVILYAIAFTCRYLDLYPIYMCGSQFLTTYNIIFKIYYLFTTYLIVFLIYGLFQKTRDKSHDSFPIFSLLLCTTGLTCMVTNYMMIDKELFWRFSIFLEIFAIIPQMHLIYKQKSIDKMMMYYLMMLGSYRAFYILNWIYRYNVENFWDPIATYCGCGQTIIYVLFFVFIFPYLNYEDRYQSDAITNKDTNYDIPQIDTIA